MNNLRCLSVLILLLSAACANEAPESPSDQTGQGRIFDLVVSDYRALPNHDPESLFNPLHISIWDESIYIIDYGDFTIKRFSLTGELLSTMLNGQGEGPGEVQNPTDFDVIGDDIWIIDPNPRRILHYKTNGELVEHIKAPDLALRMARLGSRFLLLTPMSSELFTMFDESGEVVETFGDEVSSLTDDRMALSGRFVRASSGFLFVPLKAGYVFRYDNDGRFVSSFRTIDATNFSDLEAVVEQDGKLLRPPKADVETRGASMYAGQLILYTWFREPQPHGFEQVIDRYDLETGQYEGSLGVPLSRSYLSYHGDRLFALTDSLVVFTVQRSNRL